MECCICRRKCVSAQQKLEESNTRKADVCSMDACRPKNGLAVERGQLEEERERPRMISTVWVATWRWSAQNWNQAAHMEITLEMKGRTCVRVNAPSADEAIACYFSRIGIPFQ